MKHLKKINEFYYKSDEQLYNTIDDILLDINDIPNFIALSWNQTSVEVEWEVVVVKLSEGIEAGSDSGVVLGNDITETIKRLLDFMKDNGYDHEMEIGTDNLPPGADVSIDDYRRTFKYDELDDEDLEIWQNDYIRIDFTKEK